MDHIRQRFLQAEQDFFSALRSGDDQSLVDFAEHWETLQSDWESYLHEANLSTQKLVHKVVAKIGELTGDFYAFHSHRLSLEDDLLTNLEDVFASLTLEDCATRIDSAPNNAPQSLESLSPDHEVLSPAQWLLHNLHNPYPLPHIRFSTHKTLDSKHTKDWFAKARQRIGWTRLLRDRFAGCRSLAIDAAFRAFVRDDPANPLDADLKAAFLAIKSHAELVYGEEDMKSHSSPKRSRSISPTPSLTSSSGSEDTDDERYIAPSRRIFNPSSKRAALGFIDSSLSKRRRTHQSPPSPPLQAMSVLSPPPTEIASQRSRKRRLSEGDSACPRPKRPRGIESGRLCAVSDSCSISTAPAWFNFDESFQIPSPASIDPFESCPFDLDFFDPPSLSSVVTSPIPAPLADVVVQAEDFTALFEMPPLELLQSELPTFNSDWSEFLNFETDLSIFSSSLSLTPSSTSTPPLVDDATLPPSSPLHSDPSSPNSPLEILPCLSDKGIKSPTGEPIIEGQDFLLPPGENAGIPSAGVLLFVY
ncbi:hypothetical protein BDM02DRAFT_3273633 [Thelephora ganbajun]|uniref:Uncharacterized protein n=1 Tax=Thelephora ganbajun TaxID=370292 RepID=A0ACB6YWY6_THEGA|nr:hypothetical protein BDM02DRAFT_3273633 [Thelephora ganbajun]